MKLSIYTLKSGWSLHDGLTHWRLQRLDHWQRSHLEAFGGGYCDGLFGETIPYRDDSWVEGILVHMYPGLYLRVAERVAVMSGARCYLLYLWREWDGHKVVVDLVELRRRLVDRVSH